MISVVIVNFNRKDLLKRCLDSVKGQDVQDLKGIAPFFEKGRCPLIEIIVVDNKSTDETVAMLREFGDKIKLIESPENGGFSKGNNLGIAAPRADFALSRRNVGTIAKSGFKSSVASFCDRDICVEYFFGSS